MAKDKKSFIMKNAAVISGNTIWYPFSEATGTPTDNEIDDDFPLKSFVLENKSTQNVIVVLDPIAGHSTKEFDVPNGKTLALENKDNLTFNQVAVHNETAVQIFADTIKLTVRNY